MADLLSGTRESGRSGHRVIPKERLAVGGVLVAAVLSGAFLWFRAQPDKPQPDNPRPVSRPGAEVLLAVAPAELPAVVRDRYRLRPDRRLLAAVAEVQRLRTGAAPEPVKAEFQEGRWRILSGSVEVGVLSEFPTFEEATGLLGGWAGRLTQTAAARPGAGGAALDTGPLEKAVRQVDTAALISALSSLGGSVADVQKDAEKVRSITSGLAWLTTLTVDHLEQADPLFAEAWAWLAIERANGTASSTGSETLVARALGYEEAAIRASAKLAEDDPVRLYATGNETRLAALCAGRPTDRPCHFLRLALLAERSQDERFHAAVAKSPFRDEESLAIHGLETRLSDFDGGSAGRNLAELAVRALALPAGPDEAPAEARSRDFEAAVARLSAQHGGTLVSIIDIAAIQGAYRAAFYSGLFDEAKFVLDQYASGPAAKELAASFAAPADGTAAELKHWIEVSGAVQDGSTDMRPVAEVLESARSIGAAPLADLGLTIARHSATTDPLRRRPIPALFARLDTRPSHRVMAAQVTSRNLASPWLFERFARAAAEAAPHLSEELPAQAAELREDAVRLREIADDPAMPRYTQIVALSALSDLGKADDAFLRARYQAIAADPNEGPSALVDFLEKRGDLAGAVAAEEAALKRIKEPLTVAHLQTERARLLLKMGHADRAFAGIEPALGSYKEEALLQGATIELARNHPENALSLAQASLARYPDRSSETSGLIARARWQLGDFSVAAKELAASRNGIVGNWNRYLPEAFAETFAKAPEDQARKAFAELTAAGITPHVLADVAIALGKKRDLDIALPLLEGLRDPAPEWQDSMRLATYDLIKEKSGADAALAWVRKAVPDRSHNFALTLYQMRRYDLLLGLFANGEEGDNPTLVRMIKAASLLHLRETSGPRWDGLVAEIAQDPGDGSFARGGRYLVGLTDDAKALQSFHQEQQGLASIGWIKGVKAAADRHFAEADAWFQVALESGEQGQPPHAWSWVIESEWMQTDRSLEMLEKKGAF